MKTQRVYTIEEVKQAMRTLPMEMLAEMHGSLAAQVFAERAGELEGAAWLNLTEEQRARLRKGIG